MNSSDNPGEEGLVTRKYPYKQKTTKEGQPYPSWDDADQLRGEVGTFDDDM